MHADASLEQLLDPTEPLITLLSNAAAYIFHSLDRINWAGFYLLEAGPKPSEEKLILGPFAGRPACTVIPMAKGVCGTAASERRIIRVDNVDLFPGHIACDERSRSEIVLPLITSTGRLLGVLDIDAPMLSRFTNNDEVALTHLCTIIVTKIEVVLERIGNPIRLFV